MKTFHARDHWNSFDNDDAWTLVKGIDEEDAAETYADEIWPHSEGAEHLAIQVRDATGKITVWGVRVEFYPSFHAAPYEERS